jgi:putative flavoprotein involved in K+ transport
VYVLGLPWLYTWGSGRFVGVGRDAAYVTQHLLGSSAASKGTGRGLAASAA